MSGARVGDIDRSAHRNLFDREVLLTDSSLIRVKLMELTAFAQAQAIDRGLRLWYQFLIPVDLIPRGSSCISLAFI
jgi:hypothetical protein